MVRHAAVEPKPTEPAICQIEMNLLAQAPLGPDAEAIAHDQHPDHQFGIDRWPSRRAVARGHSPPQLAKFDEPVDRPQQMTGRNVPLKRELIEQRRLFDLLMSHHDLQSCFPQRLNQRIASRATDDFFNRISHKPTSGVYSLLCSLGSVPVE